MTEPGGTGEEEDNREGWARVSLSAWADPARDDLTARLPQSYAGRQDARLACVDFGARSDAGLAPLLEALDRYLSEHRAELRQLRDVAQFEVRIGWTPRSPMECLAVPAQLLRSLGELGADIMLDGYGS